jgi:KipI family sensor histidine kinase inhibitor
MLKNISNLGDAALYCDFGIQVNKATNLEVIKYFNTIREKKIKGINNLTPSYNKLIISFDLRVTNFSEIKNKIENLDTTIEQNKNNKKIEVPVCCEENFALDKSRLEKKLNLSYQEILTKFFDKEYFCYMTGFIAGMPFLGDIDENLRTQRLETPRVKVPQGSVGITEQFANIYSFDSPGGWNIIGNTPLKVFDDSKERDPNLINPGDTIIFKKISRQEYESSNDK